MKLYEIAIASFIFNSITGFNNAYLDLLNETDGEPDLFVDSHRLEILKWLNKWGCRQFKKDFHKYASKQLYEWYKENKNLLPNKDINIWELTEFESIGKLFTSLSCKIAALRKVILSCTELEEQCKKNNFSLEEFPKIIKRPNITIPKLIDEYHWITVTRNFKIPDSKIFKEWLNFML